MFDYRVGKANMKLRQYLTQLIASLGGAFNTQVVEIDRLRFLHPGRCVCYRTCSNNQQVSRFRARRTSTLAKMGRIAQISAAEAT